jgi:hypothetical protein
MDCPAAGTVVGRTAKEEHAVSASKKPTTTAVCPDPDNQEVMTACLRGPQLLQDIRFLAGHSNEVSG